MLEIQPIARDRLSHTNSYKLLHKLNHYFPPSFWPIRTSRLLTDSIRHRGPLRGRAAAAGVHRHRALQRRLGFRPLRPAGVRWAGARLGSGARQGSVVGLGGGGGGGGAHRRVRLIMFQHVPAPSLEVFFWSRVVGASGRSPFNCWRVR